MVRTRDWAAFEEYVAKTMEENHIVGAAVAVAGPKEVLYANGFGVKDLETGEPVDPETIFGCASVSKSFTAMAIMQLADAGLLSVDDPVIAHIPEFRLKGARDMNAVKMSHILSHTTGLPPMTRRQDIIDLDEHVRYIAGADYELLGDPGEYFSYCNDTFLLSGLIIQRKSEQLYRRYMTRHILDAAGMNRSTYNLEELEKLGNLSTPYVYNRQEQKHEKQRWPVLGTYEVGGGVRSCVLDLMKYGQIYLNGGLANTGVGIVSSEGVKRMWTSPMYPTGRSTWYNFGLQVTPNYAGLDATLAEHGGSQPGVSSHFGFVPEKGITVAVLTNVTGVPAGAIWLAAVNVALGLPLETQKSVEVDCGASPEQLSRFTGLYKCDEGGQAEIFMDGDTLIVRREGQDFEAKASDERTLFFEAMGQQQVLRFYFYKKGMAPDPSGRPWAVLAGSRMLRRVTG